MMMVQMEKHATFLIAQPLKACLAHQAITPEHNKGGITTRGTILSASSGGGFW